MTLLPTLEALEAAHTRLIKDFGGSPGVRSPEGFLAALGRAETVAAYGGARSAAEAGAVLAYSITKIHHPFVDGNKRVALYALFATLDLNGLYLDARDADAAEMLENISSGDASEDDFKRWAADNAG